MIITELKGIGEIFDNAYSNDDFNLIKINNEKINCINDKTNPVFKFAYILWVMRGANTLKDLDYYSDHLKSFSDNGYTLRGAYGPRIFNWVGADQLQESITTNMDIDDIRDFVKPAGINQFLKCYEDFHDFNYDSSSFVIMDPAIDFDPSNDIPDLVSVSFRKSDKLSVIMNYNEFDLMNNHINDIYMIDFFLDKIAGFLNISKGNILINIVNIEEYHNSVNKYKVYNIRDEIEDYENCEKINDFISDLFSLFNFERHLRNIINENNVMNDEVSIEKLINSLENKIINNLLNDESKNIAYTLLIGAIKIHIKNTGDYENYIYDIVEKMNGRYKVDICEWLLYVGDIPHNLYEICQESI
jgi:hypothetical protein